MKRGVFVTGTDTGVVKTVVAAVIAAALRRRGINAGVMKPVQTGALATDTGLVAPDARFLAAVAGVNNPPELVCPVMLEVPVAPSIAAHLEGRLLDPEEILQPYHELRSRHELVVVEGAGGLMVPITASYLMSDLARDMSLPLLIVSRPSLGTINHTALTVAFARAAGLEVLGVVINRYPADPGVAEMTAARAIEHVAQVRVLGLLEECPGVDVDAGEVGTLPKLLASDHPVIGALLEVLDVAA